MMRGQTPAKYFFLEPPLLISQTFSTHNRFMALWILSGTTRVSRYQKKHSPTHTHRGHHSSIIIILHGILLLIRVPEKIAHQLRLLSIPSSRTRYSLQVAHRGRGLLPMIALSKNYTVCCTGARCQHVLWPRLPGVPEGRRFTTGVDHRDSGHCCSLVHYLGHHHHRCYRANAEE